MIQLPEVDTDDEDFLEFALLITFPRKRRFFHDGTNHFEMYDNGEFFRRFCLSETTVHYILDVIQGKVSSATTRYVTWSCSYLIFCKNALKPFGKITPQLLKCNFTWGLFCKSQLGIFGIPKCIKKHTFRYAKYAQYTQLAFTELTPGWGYILTIEEWFSKMAWMHFYKKWDMSSIMLYAW